MSKQKIILIGIVAVIVIVILYYSFSGSSSTTTTTKDSSTSTPGVGSTLGGLVSSWFGSKSTSKPTSDTSNTTNPNNSISPDDSLDSGERKSVVVKSTKRSVPVVKKMVVVKK